MTGLFKLFCVIAHLHILDKATAHHFAKVHNLGNSNYLLHTSSAVLMIRVRLSDVVETASFETETEHFFEIKTETGDFSRPITRDRDRVNSRPRPDSRPGSFVKFAEFCLHFNKFAELCLHFWQICKCQKVLVVKIIFIRQDQIVSRPRPDTETLSFSSRPRPQKFGLGIAITALLKINNMEFKVNQECYWSGKNGNYACLIRIHEYDQTFFFFVYL